MCFALVEGEDFFAGFSWFVSLGHQRIFNPVLDEGVKIFGPIFFHFIGFLFPFVFCKLNFVGLFTHLVVPIFSLDEMSDDALAHLNSLMG